MPASADQLCRVAIVGASSLVGKELKQVLEDRAFPSGDVRLLDDEAAGTLTEAGGEATFIRNLDEDSFEGARFAFFAGAPEFAAQHWSHAHRAGAAVIDLTGALAGVPAAIPWIPALDAVLPPPQVPVGKLFSSPDVPAIVACRVAAALREFSPARLAILFLQPVSERGQPGIDELEGQTVSLLSFQPIAQPVFDAQVAFNLLGRWGPASRPGLCDRRAACARQAAAYLAGRAPVPAIQLVQAPVFFSYVFSAMVELASAREPAELQQAMMRAGCAFESDGEPPVSNVSVAGEDQVMLSRLEPDPNAPATYWLWGAADNVRLAALNAITIAEKLLAS